MRVQNEPVENSRIAVFESARFMVLKRSVKVGSTPMRVQNEFVENSRIVVYGSTPIVENANEYSILLQYFPLCA